VVAGRKRAKAAALAHQQKKFKEVMGSPGQNGVPVLAVGLEDVSVRFGARRKKRSGKLRSRRKRCARTGAGASGDGGEARKRVRRKRRRHSAFVEDDEEADEEVDEGASEEAKEETDGAADARAEEAAADEVGARVSGEERGGDAKRARVLPEEGEMIRVFWTGERVWFRAVVASREGFVVRVEYVVRGWEALDHDLNGTTWERWEEGGPIDPKEADYEGEQWLGETDWLAERAVQVAREAAGGRGARVAAREEARKRRQEGGGEEGEAKRDRRGRLKEVGEESGGKKGSVARGKRGREVETTERCVRRLLAVRWAEGGGRDEARVREVWADAGKEGISVREVGRVIRLMDKAGELMESEGVLHNLM